MGSTRLYTIGQDDAFALSFAAAKLAAKTLWHDGDAAVRINRPPVWVYRGPHARADRAVGYYAAGTWRDCMPGAW